MAVGGRVGSLADPRQSGQCRHGESGPCGTPAVPTHGHRSRPPSQLRLELLVSQFPLPASLEWFPRGLTQLPGPW